MTPTVGLRSQVVAPIWWKQELYDLWEVDRDVTGAGYLVFMIKFCRKLFLSLVLLKEQDRRQVQSA